MMLEEMFRRQKVLIFFKKRLIEKGYSFKQLAYINSQLELLDRLIKQGSAEFLNGLLKEKTYYTLFKEIEKGHENLVDILKHPENWQLDLIKGHEHEWRNKEALIFSTEIENEVCVFTKNNYGQKYRNNKWQ
jgi:hypothetical protein